MVIRPHHGPLVVQEVDKYPVIAVDRLELWRGIETERHLQRPPKRDGRSIESNRNGGNRNTGLTTASKRQNECAEQTHACETKRCSGQKSGRRRRLGPALKDPHTACETITAGPVNAGTRQAVVVKFELFLVEARRGMGSFCMATEPLAVQPPVQNQLRYQAPEPSLFLRNPYTCRVFSSPTRVMRPPVFRAV